MSSHFRGKKTLQEHTEHLIVFLSAGWILKPNQSIFYKLGRSHQKCQNLEKLDHSTTLR